MENNILPVEIKKETLVYNVNQLFEKYGKDYVLIYFKELIEENDISPKKYFEKTIKKEKNLQWTYQNI
tara:strand:+ start:387 stop:590 length:204 start_codon:yes stop_codon:yes gene_type:complete